MKILIIVDVQNDFTKHGKLEVPEGEKVVPVTNALMESGYYDLHIASQDWHPRGHKSFASSHTGHSMYSVIDLGGFPQVLWPDHCVEGTDGAALHPDLKMGFIDRVIKKGTNEKVDSYSVFFDNNKLCKTELDDFLRHVALQHHIPKSELELDFVGLALDYCVAFSAKDSVNLGYKTRLIVDATRAVNLQPGDDLKALRELAEAGVEVIESRDILENREIQLPAAREIGLPA
jgi:nicotinamidase/pyrazinamidase